MATLVTARIMTFKIINIFHSSVSSKLFTYVFKKDSGLQNLRNSTKYDFLKIQNYLFQKWMK